MTLPQRPSQPSPPSISLGVLEEETQPQIPQPGSLLSPPMQEILQPVEGQDLLSCSSSGPLTL